MIQNLIDASKAEAEGGSASPPSLSPMWRQAGFLARNEKVKERRKKDTTVVVSIRAREKESRRIANSWLYPTI